MIQLRDLAYSIGERRLLAGVDWVLSPGDRCALVGSNGTGKTTLLRLMLGELSPESGTRALARGTRIGYLPQEAAERYEGTVLERAMEAHRHVLGMREELDELHGRLAGIGPDDPALGHLLERLGELQHRLELADEHALEPEARRVLAGLGFERITAGHIEIGGEVVSSPATESCETILARKEGGICFSWAIWLVAARAAGPNWARYTIARTA